jgi:titin
MAFIMGENWPPLLRVKHQLWISCVALIAVVLGALNSTAATLTVINANDSGAGSLRQAILDANTINGLDTIVFQIPGAGVHTIVLSAALPPITDPVVMDGTSQPGYAGTPLIELNGTSAGSSAGLRLLTAGSTISGLAINRFVAQGLLIQGAGSNVVQGNFIGTDPSGTIRRGNSIQGIWLNGSSGNLIGGTNASEGNLIAGNGDIGIYLGNSGSNTIQGNFIGTTITGMAALSNANNGIYLINSPGNMVGGLAPTARNIISGNGGSGVYLSGSGTTGNLVQGNYIGTGRSGSLALPNAVDGVTVNSAAGNTIGGVIDGAGNLISGNRAGGVALNGVGAANNLVQGNYIGTDVSGRLALGNMFSGITINGGSSNLVGGTAAAARNVLSANKLSGVLITTNSVGNLVQGNFIGVDGTGTNALGNVFDGISIDSASFNTVGGTTSGARNIISGNTNHGIEIFNATATGNSIQGNYIGPAVTGQSALGNKLCGMHILSPGNTIGGTQGGAGNLISGNVQDGIFLDGSFLAGSTAANNLVQGNFIGTTASGTSGLGNGRAGVGVSGAPGNTIGGAVAGAGNLVSGNSNQGIYLLGTATTGNLIQGNKIGTDVNGTAGLGNATIGIYLDRALTNTIGGSLPGAGNLISDNRNWGIYMINNASWNTFQGNLIGTTINGLTGLGNGYANSDDTSGFHAVELQPGCHDNIIGGASPGAGNVIAFAPVLYATYYAGIRIRDGAINNLISGNSIFANGGLGIDLGVYLVTANDDCDADTGANMLQNFPVLAQAVSGNGTGVRGTLNSKASSSFLVQFFANPACDFLGYGEGQVYLGQQMVVTSNNCNASFVAALPGQVPVGFVITATATDSANNTSEFSACVPVSSVPSLAVVPATNHQVSIAWTNTATGFVLKQTDSLSPPVQWAAVTNSPVVNNGQLVVTLPADAGNRFYVLSFE